MIVLALTLALLAALGNAAASVLQRRSAATAPLGSSGRRLSWLIGLVRRPLWLLGAAALAVSGLFQAVALAAAPLAIVQPVMTTELLFTLLVGSFVFRRPPDRRTRWSFLAMAVGLAAFLGLAAPSGSADSAKASHWVMVGPPAVVVVVLLVLIARHLKPAGRAAVLGAATAIGFAFTAALVKDAIGNLAQGLVGVVTSWQLYTALGIGLVSFVLLQTALRAGPLVASQPALTLGDSLLSVFLGVLLFGERIVLGVRMLPEAAALVLLVLGSVGLARSPLVSGTEGQEGKSW
ncbi:DMT family transporter [Streptomyces sp. TP-A0874]|uniref:DMT family transporter n=1 Tax=Streptomyces sp. TP-A0874 TaxID=549819 RepID=UPI000853C0FC|nr:DMT family transporter [Streptomyces sp. TP-A0874]